VGSGGDGRLLRTSGSSFSSNRCLAASLSSQTVSLAISVDAVSLSLVPSSVLFPRSQELLDHRLKIEDLAEGLSAGRSGDAGPSEGGVAVPENAFFLLSPAHCVQDEIYAVAFEGASPKTGDVGAA